MSKEGLELIEFFDNFVRGEKTFNKIFPFVFDLDSEALL